MNYAHGSYYSYIKKWAHISSIMNWVMGSFLFYHELGSRPMLLNRLRFIALIISLMFHLSQSGLPKKKFHTCTKWVFEKKKKAQLQISQFF